MRRTLLGAAAVALLAVSGCSAGDRLSPARTAGGGSASPGSGPAATAGLGAAPPPAGALDGKRQVILLPRLDDIELPDSVLAVTASGRLQVTDDYTERALFVPVPRGGGGPERLIKTGAMRADGRPFCLQVQAGGAVPLTVFAADCDAAEPAQLFVFETTGEDTEDGTTYSVRNRDAFLQWHPMDGLGLVAEELGDARLTTTFTLMDQGAAALPARD